MVSKRCVSIRTLKHEGGLATGQINAVEADDDEKGDSLFERHLLGEEERVVVLETRLAIHPVHHAFAPEGGEGRVRFEGGGGSRGRGGGGDEAGATRVDQRQHGRRGRGGEQRRHAFETRLLRDDEDEDNDDEDDDNDEGDDDDDNDDDEDDIDDDT